MTQEVLMLMGPPASGKSGLSKEITKGHVVLNRDSAGKAVIDLLPKMEAALRDGKNVLLDNLFATADSRKPFLEAAKKAKVPVHAHYMDTKIEDATINALWRMINNFQQVFLAPQDIANHAEAKKSPNVFPIAVLFKYKKELQMPVESEGFSSIKKHKFKRKSLGSEYKNVATIFDYDDTLRRSNGELAFPTKIADVEILPGRKEKLQALKKAGHILLGVSNQSGIARKQLSDDDAKACFEHTNKLLGASIDFCYCPHNVPPTCYCRKPQSGLGVWLIYKHKLDPSQVTFVGDQTTDKTWAARLGFHYAEAEEFFK